MQIKITVVLMSLAVMAGCSTKFAGLQDVSIMTDPAGVKAAIDDQSCITPCSLKNVDRTSEYIVFERGAQKQQLALEKNYNPAGTVKVKLFPGIEMGVSAFLITGAAYEIQPIDVKLGAPGDAPISIVRSADKPAGSGGASETVSSSTGTTQPSGSAGESGIRFVEVPGTKPMLPSERVVPLEAVMPPEPDERPFAVTAGSSFVYLGNAYLVSSHIGIEKMVGTRWSVYANGGYTDSRVVDTTYEDIAHGLAWEVGMAAYSRGRPLEGWHYGFGLGGWSLKGSWKDDVGTPFVTEGKGAGDVFQLNGRAGYKWFPAALQGFFIDPSIAIGLMRSNGHPSMFGPNGFYVNAGLVAGMRW